MSFILDTFHAFFIYTLSYIPVANGDEQERKELDEKTKKDLKNQGKTK